MRQKGIVACFGEVLLRYSSSGGQDLRNAAALDVYPGGAEANVAVGLANLGRATRMISALPANELGALARRALLREGVDTSFIDEAPGRMGIYYVTPAGPLRQSSVIYDRAGSSFALHRDLDATAALENAQHLHVSGISLAVSEASRASTLALAQHARDKGLTISFDGNYRPALWHTQNCDPQPVIAQMVRLTDLFFGNHKDMGLLLARDFSGTAAARRREAAITGFAAFPNLSAIASTARHVDETDTHHIVGRIDTPSTEVQSSERVLANVVDRIGTGDAFAAGIIDGWLDDPKDLTRALDQGMALAGLKHYARGDFSLARRTELQTAIMGSGDVLR